MCGIAGVYLRDPKLTVDLDDLLDTMVDRIDHRGGDATGYLALDSKGVAEWHRAACGGRDFTKYRRPVPKGTRIIMAHTRWATQGLPAFMENNHPVRRGTFYVIHNGHVSNDQELFKLADRKPFGQVDSEAIPARLASLGSLDKADVVMEEIEGAAAIAAVDSREPRRLVLARGNSSPLHVLVTDKIVLWGSTQDTVKVAYKKHIGRLPKKHKIESVPGRDAALDQQPVSDSNYVRAVPAQVAADRVVLEGRRRELGHEPKDACIVPTKGMPTVGGWPQWDKDGHVVDEITEEYADKHGLIECDVCSEWIRYTDAHFEPEPGSDFAWTLCDKCKDVDLDAPYEGSEDPAVVNAAILSRG